jgi:CDP-glycerol glycerophosphotransferase (TagB/SpsB family)
MAGRSELKRAAKRVAVGPVRDRGVRLAGALARRGSGTTWGGGTTVLIVVEIEDRAQWSRCLESVRRELGPGDRAVLCPVARSLEGAVVDGSVETLPPQPTWQMAANAGAARADSEFIVFLRGSDRLLPGALGALTRDARSAPDPVSPVPVGAEGRLRDARGRIAVLPTRLSLGNRLIRSSVWRSADCRLDDRDQWFLAAPVARLLEKGKFRETGRVVAEVVSARGARSVAADPSPLLGLDPWLAHAHRLRAGLADRPGGSVDPRVNPLAALREDTATAWLPMFLLDAERASSAQWDLLVRAAEESRMEWPETHVASTPARVLRWLAAADRRDEVIQLAAELETLDTDIPTRLANRRVIAQWSSLPGDVPQSVASLSAAETRLKRHVHRMVGDAESRVVDLFVTIDRVDLAGATTELTAVGSDGESIPVSRTDAGAIATRWWQRRFQSGEGGTFRFTVFGPDPATVNLRFTVDKLVRTGRLIVPPPANKPRRAASVVIDAVAVVDRKLVVSGEGRIASLRLDQEAGPPVTLPIAAVSRDTAIRSEADLDEGEVVLSLEATRFGRVAPLPPGRYRLVSSRGHTQATAALRAAAPLHRVGSTYRQQVDVDRARRWLGVDPVRLWLRPPLSDDELGPYAQRRLQDRYHAHVGPVVEDLFYFETYAGRSATDNPLALFRELRAERPGLRAYWGVSDHSQWVPDGATALVRFSAEWYDVLATAGCLVVNTDVEPWFRKRPGQFVVQCFHGYPAKAMGAMQWELNELPPSKIRTLRRRGVDIWDLILTPTPAMTRHYREQYDYQGPVFERGYPRNDDLTGPDAESRRSRVRRILGIRPGQTAVLYAPTWRDHLSTRPRAADMTDFFDVTEATKRLGESHVILVRGHRFHQPVVDQPGALDVTEYPEINDLILASDAAVLDYSSVRFDYALTGKPMIFLVPDLDDFSGTSRGFLFPFLDSAPGPLVEDTELVIDHLHDVARLQQRYGDRIEAFNETYNPHQDGQAAQRAVAALLHLRGL